MRQLGKFDALYEFLLFRGAFKAESGPSKYQGSIFEALYFD
jgi:hypothetical protein